MIYKYFSAASFEEETWKMVSQLAKMPTKALALTKEALNQSLTSNLEEQLALESKNQIEAASTADYQEGVNAFIEKRKPNFKGK